jgi:hypothetical protein
MTLPLRISVKNALLLTFWVAVWFANVGAIDRYEEWGGELLERWEVEWEAPIYWLWYVLIATPPAAVVGILCGHPLTGILCGLLSSCAMIAVMERLIEGIPI